MAAHADPEPADYGRLVRCRPAAQQVLDRAGNQVVSPHIVYHRYTFDDDGKIIRMVVLEERPDDAYAVS